METPHNLRQKVNLKELYKIKKNQEPFGDDSLLTHHSRSGQRECGQITSRPDVS